MSGRPSVYIGETLAMVTVRNSNSYWIRILPPTGVLSIDRLRPSRIYAVAYTIERDTMHFWPKVMKLVCTRCTLLKFGENNFSLVEIIDIFRYPRWWPQPSRTFLKCAHLTQRIDARWCQVYSVNSCWEFSSLRKLLTFFDIQDGGRLHLWFWTFCFFTIGVDGSWCQVYAGEI